LSIKKVSIFRFSYTSLINNIFTISIDIEKELEIGKEFLFDFVFMNPITMKLCNFKIGNYLVIEDSQGEYISVKCWPLLSLQIDRISLSKQIIFDYNLTIETPSSIRRIFKIIKEDMFDISQITLNPIFSKLALNENDLKKLLPIYLKGIYLKKFITKNQLISVIYMGQKLVLEIENMITNEKKKKKEENKTDTLNEKFEKLDLNKSLIFNESNLKPIDSNLFDKNVSLYLIDQKTSVKIINISDDEKTKNMENLVMFKDVGGLKDEIKKLKQLFINPFEFSNIYKNLGNYFLKKLR
jgi:hypothetical protein